MAVSLGLGIKVSFFCCQRQVIISHQFIFVKKVFICIVDVLHRRGLPASGRFSTFNAASGGNGHGASLFLSAKRGSILLSLILLLKYSALECFNSTAYAVRIGGSFDIPTFL